LIVVATPARDTVQATFAYDLAQLIKYSPDVVFTIALGSIIPNNRTQLVTQSLNAGADYILFIDSDMRFPQNTVSQLITQDKQIIGANCKQRTKNEWTARKAGKFISSDDKFGVEQVDTLGFGVTLIKAEVFEKIAHPWFEMTYDPIVGKLIGEDVDFCTKARIAGFDIFVDHALSHEVKHTGSIEL